VAAKDVKMNCNPIEVLRGPRGIKGDKGDVGMSGGVALIGKLDGSTPFNANSTSDQLITLFGGTNFVITDIVMVNPSTNLSACDDLEWWDQTGRSGNQIAAMSNQVFSYMTLSSSMARVGETNLFIRLKTHSTVSNSIYASLGTPLGTTGTADIYIYGYVLS